MLDFGLIDSWQPSAGTLISWRPSDDTMVSARRAPAHPVPPSHQQHAYLIAAHRHRNAHVRFSRLCLMAFDIDAPLDVMAMTRTIDRFFIRHDTFSSWFAVTGAGEIERHVLPDGIGGFLPRIHGHLDGHRIREHVEQSTPGPFEWNCFTVGAIDRGDHFSVYLAVDHLHSDGISQALSCVDLMSIYAAETSTSAEALSPAGSYLDYCRREREHTQALTLSSPLVRRWVNLIAAHDGRLPTFPLALGLRDAASARTASITVEVFDETSARQLDQICRAHGAGFVSAVLAAAAVTAYEFTGEADYFGFTPKSTRATAAEFSAVGWFVNLIPVTAAITTSSTFTQIVTDIHASYSAGKLLSEVSLHRVLEMLPEKARTHIPPDWVVPMVSYLDVRKLPGGSMFDHVNLGVYGNRGSSEEVYVWVNRFPTGTSMTLLYPDTAVAHTSVRRYVDRFATILRTVGTRGDYTVGSG